VVSESNELLDLPAGTALQLQLTVPEKAPRHMVRLIGSLPAGSLVVTTPTVNGKVQLVREGQRFNVRVLKGERVVGFIAQVLFVALKPYAHLHLEYPSEFEQIVIRNASRVRTELPAQVQNAGDSGDKAGLKPATIIDLSETGAGLATSEALGRSGDMLQLQFKLYVSGGEETLSVMAEICSSTPREDAKGFVSGVAFRAMNRFQQVLLHAWVTRRLLDEAMHVH
jgi:hypothetical protein